MARGDLREGNHDSEWGEWFEAGGWWNAMVPSVPAAMIRTSAVVVWTLAAALPVEARAQSSPSSDGQVPADPVHVDVLVEIPAGSIAKYEIDHCTGVIRVDRFLSAPMVYPANYGYVDSTMGGDGDPLDVLLITREPVVPASIVRARVLGVLRMVDDGEEDHKLIAVPAPEVDPAFAAMDDIDDLDPIELERLLTFFAVYKSLPPPGGRVVLGGIGDRREAAAMLEAAFARAVGGAPCGGVRPG